MQFLPVEYFSTILTNFIFAKIYVEIKMIFENKGEGCARHLDIENVFSRACSFPTCLC